MTETIPIREMIERAKTQVSIGVKFRNPDQPAKSKLEKSIVDHLWYFAEERGEVASVSHPTGSRYDFNLHLSPGLAKEYLPLVKNLFPDYSFIYTIDPKENFLKNCVPLD